MVTTLNAEVAKKLKALSDLTDKSVDELVNMLLSNSIKSLKPFQSQPPSPDDRMLNRQARSAVLAQRPTRGSLAEQIRDYVVDRFVEPARERGEKEITIKSGEVHRGLELRNRLPAVCAVLGSDIFPRMACIERLSVQGPANGATTEFRFKL